MPKVVARRAIETLAKCSDAKVILRLFGQLPAGEILTAYLKHYLFVYITDTFILFLRFSIRL